MEGQAIKRGDIYYIVSNYQEEGSEQYGGRPAIIVSNDINNQHSPVIEIVYLTTRPKTELPTHIDIRSSTRPSIALCEQVYSVSKDRLGDKVAECTKQEMELLDAALLISLGIDMPPVKVIEKKVEVEKVVKDENVLKNARENEAMYQNEILRLQTRLETYAHLYKDLLEKVIVGNVVGV